MTRAFAINGSPRMEEGNTAMVLSPFTQGMVDAGCEVELFYASRLKVKPCSCSEMYCWYKKPGECCIKDEMNVLYPKMKKADILILATPVYIPLPGGMQQVINRLCPLMKPLLETRDGRTRARFREDVEIKKVVLVSTSGWWEMGNFTTVVRIAEEIAKDASVEFAGAVLRPHAMLMKDKGQLTEAGQAVLAAARRAGSELVRDGAMSKQTLEAISRPLIPQEDLRQIYNSLV
jgi:multimeric flavodoxin WrbA